MTPSSILTQNSKRLMLFSGRSNLDLGLKIAEHLGIVLGDLELKTFSNQEIYVRYKENIRGSDIFRSEEHTSELQSH